MPCYSDYVFHLAAVADVNYAHKNPATTVEVNVTGTYNVAEACLRTNIPLSFASTCCIYGNTPEHPSNEESLCLPTEIYAATKLVGEQILLELHKKHGLNYNLLRFGTCYGPEMRGALAIYIFILQALTGIPLTIHGTGTQTRCLIYIDDLIDGIVKTLDKGVLNETLNIATEEELSVLQMADIILEKTGQPKDAVSFVPDRSGQMMRELIDMSKAEKLLGWTPKTEFREGIEKTLEWFYAQGIAARHR